MSSTEAKCPFKAVGEYCVVTVINQGLTKSGLHIPEVEGRKGLVRVKIHSVGKDVDDPLIQPGVTCWVAEGCDKVVLEAPYCLVPKPYLFAVETE